MYTFNYFTDKYNNLLEKLEKTPQDPIWHSEGNVLIHTEMVLNALNNLIEYNELTEEEKRIVAYAAFFHDIGKPITTKEENGRIISPGHSKVGEKDCRIILAKENESFHFRENVCMLIRYHSYPIHYFEKKSYKIVEMSFKLNTKLLYILAKADLLGRISKDNSLEEYLMNIDYFKEQALFYDCWGKQKEFENDKARLHFLKTGELYTPFEEKRSTVYLMCGLPGSGKDSYIKNNLNNIKEISLDKLREKREVRRGNKKDEGQLVQYSKLLAKQYLANNEDFVWNATNLSASFRRDLISIFLDYTATVKIVYIERKLSEVFKSNDIRGTSFLIDYVKMKFQTIDIPDLTECHEIIYKLEL